jgi:hypothetical protein
VVAPSEGKQCEGDAHRGQGRRCGGNDDVFGDVGELRWRATVVIGTCSTEELRGSVMWRKNGGKPGERWSSPKGSNDGGVAAKSGGVGGAPVSRCGREIEGGEGEGVEHSC